MRTNTLVVLIAIAVVGVSSTAMAHGVGGGGKGGPGRGHFSHSHFSHRFLNNRFVNNRLFFNGWGWGDWGWPYDSGGYSNTTVAVFPQAIPQVAGTGAIGSEPCRWNNDTFNVPSSGGGARPVQVVSCR
jgi:hypothetical protein